MSGSRCRRYGRTAADMAGTAVGGGGRHVSPEEEARVGRREEQATSEKQGREAEKAEHRLWFVRWVEDGWMDKVEGVDKVSWAFLMGLSSNFKSTNLLFLLA